MKNDGGGVIRLDALGGKNEKGEESQSETSQDSGRLELIYGCLLGLRDGGKKSSI